MTTLRDLSRSRSLLSILLILGAALFAIGVGLERRTVDSHTTTEAAATATPHTETGGETGVETSAATVAASASQSESAGESSGERVFGLKLESTALLIIAVAISFALAALTWRSNLRLVVLAAAAFSAVFAIFDIAEAIHQGRSSRAGVATLAVIIAVVHLAAAALAQHRASVATALTRAHR